MALSLQALALAIWFGGGLSMLYATRAIFGVAESRRQAGRFSGAALGSFRWLQAAAIVLYVAAGFAGARGAARVAPTLAALLTILSLPVDARLRNLRDEMGGSSEGLEPGDPRRKRFGTLHGASVLLLIGQVLCAGIGLVLLRQ